MAMCTSRISGGTPSRERDMISLDKKVAIVTGGAHGIGRAIAEMFAEAGAQVIIADIDEQGASVPNVRFVHADVAVKEDAARVVEAATAIIGRIDILCNNAGYLGAAHPALEASDEE